MRLIDTKTGKFVQILDPLKIPPYAILSHTWENLEQSYQDVVRIQEQYGLSSPPDREGPAQILPGSPSFARRANSRASHTRCSIWDAGSGLSDKIRKACETAHRDGYHFIWIDSCCIDKTSSSELSEAINSMFNWYRNAQICYAFLSDVPSPEDVRRPWVSRFRGSRWFRRGWTLQELIAPRVVVFVSEKWDPIGTKDALAKSVEDITHIDRRILTHEKALADESVAERMRWAARRETTRVEDQAYSLLGIFGISMPTLYGEGVYAFRRLQEEILQRIPDQSLFAWGSRCLPIPRGPAQITVLSQPTSNSMGDSNLSPFAPSPRSFNRDLSEGRITRASALDFQSLQLPMEEYIPTPHGIRTKLYLLPLQAVNPKLSVTGLNTSIGPTHSSAWHLAVLKCQNADIQDHLLSRLCYLSSGPESNIPFLHVPKEILIPSTEDGPPRIHHNSGLPGAHGVVLTIPLNIVCAGLELKTVYLPRPTLSVPERRLDDPWNPATFELSLPAWIRAALQLHSYSVSDIMVTKGRTEHPPAPDTHSFTILNASPTTQYRFQFRYAPLFYGPDRNACIVIEARVWCPHSVSSARPGLGGDVHNNTVHPHPPYASAIWADEQPWAMDLPLRSVNLPSSGSESTDEVQLQLGLDLVAPGQYNIHVRVPTNCHEETTSNRSTRGLLGGRNMMNTPHTEIELTMLGTVRRELEAQGYSVHLKRPNRKRGSSGSHSGQYSLVISNSDSAFSISIDYFHAILARKPSPASSPSTYRNPGSTQQDLLIAARVALRSSSPASTVTGSEKYLDGPYVVGWSDQSPWQWCLQRKHVSLTTPNGEMLTLHLGLDLAWQSEYYLLVDIQRSGNPSILRRVSNPTHPPAVDLPDLLDCLDHGVSLTLPGHVERALQEQGFGVRFRRAAKDGLHSCRLTLSHGNQVTVGIDFSNHLVSRLGDDRDFSGNQLQELTFRACVKLLSSSQSGHPNDASHTASPIEVMEWVAWRSVDKLNPIRQRILKLRGRRRWHLPCKDVKLMLPSGFELTLRLGLYLVWPPEYCLVVEVIPQSETSLGSL